MASKRGSHALPPPPPKHEAVPSLASSQALEAARRELNVARKVQAEALSGTRAPDAALAPWPVTEASGAATYLAYLYERGSSAGGKPVEYTESPAHLAALLRHEMAREEELMAADAARAHNARAQLKAVQGTYAQGVREVTRCAQSRRYGAETNRALQDAIGRTLGGMQGFAPPAESGKGAR